MPTPEARSAEPRARRRFVLPLLPAALVFALFAILSASAPPSKTRLLTFGIVGAALVYAVERIFLGRERRAREATRDALHRTTAGDLTLHRDGLDDSFDPGLAQALHGLVVGMERILSSFVRLSDAVSAVARDLSLRGRQLAEAARAQRHRAEETAVAIQSNDTAISSLRSSMETLSAAADNAGASLHEMSTSIGEVSRSTAGLRTFVDETTGTLNGMLSALHEVASAVENLSTLAEETARATASIKETTLSTDRQTRTGARLAERVSAAAMSGKSAVSGTALGMNAVRESVVGAAQAAATLGERSERIGEILRVIEEIAGETNLLALNASIIAAQAGESGRAFSVLAGDIRDLSERTALSTEEVRGLVSAVREGVDEVRRLLSDARGRTDEGVDLARKADGTLDDIQRLSAESRRVSDGIATAAEQQALEVARVSEASTHVSEEVARIFRATRGQVETAREVGARAERVRDLTGQISRALEEQAAGSRTVLQSMGHVTSTVEDIAMATATLVEGSSSVVSSMEGIRQASAENAYAAAAMNQTSMGLEQEALMLKARASIFRFPVPLPGGRLRAALRYLDEENFDPAYSQTVPAAVLAATWGETLVRFGEGTRIVPSLAERWEVDATGRLYTFHLRRGVRFHDGSAMGAHEVKASFERFLSPELAAPLAGFFDAVEGAPDFRQGRARHVRGLETPDSSTLTVRLAEPLPFFLQLLTLTDCTVVPPSLSDRKKARLSPLGTGAFFPREIRFGQAARFDRFDLHWNRSQVALDGVDLDLVEDTEAGVLQRFLDQRLDVIWDIPAPDAARLAGDPAWRPYLDSSVQLHTSFLALRCDKPPLDDVRVRRALNLAIDRNLLNERFLSGLSVVASSLLPPHVLGHDPTLRPYRCEPEKARQLLVEAGYPNGLKLTAWLTPKDNVDPKNPFPELIASFAAIGIEVKLEVMPGDDMAARKKRGERPHLRLTRWFADFPDPDSFFNSLLYSKTEDVAELGYTNEHLDRLVERGARAMDGREREAIYRELNRLVQDEAPVVFLFHNRGFVLHQPWVRGVRSYFITPSVRFSELWFER